MTPEPETKDQLKQLNKQNSQLDKQTTAFADKERTGSRKDAQQQQEGGQLNTPQKGNTKR